MRGRPALLLVCLAVVGCGHKPPYQGKGVAELERMLDDPDPAVQVQGAFGLGRLGTDARPAVRALVRTLGSSSSTALVRQQAAGALGAIGSPDDGAVAALTSALADKEWEVRRQAAVALGQIGPPARAAGDDLRRCRRDAHKLVRQAAEESLAKIGEAK